jgi:sulfopyruvate decarboxylase TPP-binding subunit
MFTGPEFVALLERSGFTHVAWLPDSTLGPWEPALEAALGSRLVRVCREGEAWTVAAGLWLGGAVPLVVIQCTGFFESGDALRNVLHDYRLPLYAVVGYRSFHDESTLPGDTARIFAEPLLKAWQLDYRLITHREQAETIVRHAELCRREGRPGVALLAEGRA